ncbi:HAD family hydrolase [Halobacillus rhizosphaerae]|uniref:HAD family hydrolase n=1 Tax=Halobacillus rhizosphaerae TaxID=3064889 RepID=UPI00398A67D5
MKVFASDLDRTLIYSKRMIEQYSPRGPYEVIEKLENRDLSFISKEAKRNLEEWAYNQYFIPVTTRTTEQYKRIQLFHEEIKPTYAITCNGAVILKDGEVLEEWTSRIHNDLRHYFSVTEMEKELKTISFYSHVQRIRKVDPYFFYCIVDPHLKESIDVRALINWTEARNWQLSWQGKKVYFIPGCIDKWRAVKFITGELGISEVYTAGDSSLDLNLIINGQPGIVPSHGEVLDAYPDLFSTDSHGMDASEEITSRILNLSFYFT